MQKKNNIEITTSNERISEAVFDQLIAGDIDALWKIIVFYEGKQFYTSKGLPFQYTIKGKELFCDRRERSITCSTFERGYQKIIQSIKEGNPITGPKRLGLFGAPYVWSILKGVGVLEYKKED